jgi:hypothetical protein
VNCELSPANASASSPGGGVMICSGFGIDHWSLQPGRNSAKKPLKRPSLDQASPHHSISADYICALFSHVLLGLSHAGIKFVSEFWIS